VQQLERRLTGQPLAQAERILQAYYATAVEIPGVAAADWLAVLGAKAGG
jgi:hypothetical protein